MDTFCNGELLHSIFLFQRFLAMRWNGIMNLSRNTALGQITLQFIPAGRKDGEDVEDIGFINMIRMDSTL